MRPFKALRQAIERRCGPLITGSRRRSSWRGRGRRGVVELEFGDEHGVGVCVDGEFREAEVAALVAVLARHEIEGAGDRGAGVDQGGAASREAQLASNFFGGSAARNAGAKMTTASASRAEKTGRGLFMADGRRFRRVRSLPFLGRGQECRFEGDSCQFSAGALRLCLDANGAAFNLCG